jgi:hypothetical protein
MYPEVETNEPCVARIQWPLEFTVTPGTGNDYTVSAGPYDPGCEFHWEAVGSGGGLRSLPPRSSSCGYSTSGGWIGFSCGGNGDCGCHGCSVGGSATLEGASFDLMYVNQQYQRQYAFLRKSDTEVLLVVANFEEQSADMDVMIPAHAFDYLQIKEKNTIATDLLSGKKKRIVLRRDETVSMQLPPLGAVVLKFKA